VLGTLLNQSKSNQGKCMSLRYYLVESFHEVLPNWGNSHGRPIYNGNPPVPYPGVFAHCLLLPEEWVSNRTLPMWVFTNPGWQPCTYDVVEMAGGRWSLLKPEVGGRPADELNEYPFWWLSRGVSGARLLDEYITNPHGQQVQLKARNPHLHPWCNPLPEDQGRLLCTMNL